MPENIFKVFRPTDKEQERKGRGSWYNDTAGARFEHVKVALSRYCDADKDYDYLDLVWHIKNAVIGGVYVSNTVYEGIVKGNIWNTFVCVDNRELVCKDEKFRAHFEIINGIVNGTTNRQKEEDKRLNEFKSNWPGLDNVTNPKEYWSIVTKDILARYREVNVYIHNYPK